MRPTPKLYALSFAFWSIPAILLFVLAGRERNYSMHAQVLLEVLPWYYWALVTPGTIALAHRWPAESLKTLRGFLTHLAHALLSGALCGVIFLLAAVAIGGDMGTAPMHVMIVRGMLFWCMFGLVFYSMIALVGFTLGAQQRLREREIAASKLEMRLVEAQLGALRMQIHPHFLFNTLNTVAMYIREGDAQTSIRALTRLSELLRHLLDDGGAHEVPLSVEIDHVRKYLEIEALRFSDRMKIEVDVPAELQDALVPNLVLQPLVENAVKHGIAARSASGLIRISADRVGYSLRLRVSNDGPPVNGSFKPGIGVTNTRKRIAHLYGDNAHLSIDNDDGLVVSELRLPLHTEPVTMSNA